MACISALSTIENTESALANVLEKVRSGMGGEPADLVLLFVSSHHAKSLGRIAAEVRRTGLARHLMGCTGESIVGEDQEVEGSAALSLWAIKIPGMTLTPHRLTADGEGVFGWQAVPSAPIGRTLILLGDPFSFPGEQFLKKVNESSTGLNVVGGMASAGQAPGANRLVLDGDVFDDGAVAVEVGGTVRVRTVVSQGCRPIGHTMIVTKTDRNVIRELGRRPAMNALREVFESLDEADQERVQSGLHIGRVINEYQESFQRGDFLVRNVMGADDSTGIAVNDVIRVGQTVQFHVRDADSADEDLRTLLATEGVARAEKQIHGALLFTCNGRGARLFPQPNHDVSEIHRTLGPVPVAGFFAMGEIGPVGGQNFLHGFTASIALFEAAVDALG